MLLFLFILTLDRQAIYYIMAVTDSLFYIFYFKICGIYIFNFILLFFFICWCLSSIKHILHPDSFRISTWWYNIQTVCMSTSQYLYTSFSPELYFSTNSNHTLLGLIRKSIFQWRKLLMVYVKTKKPLEANCYSWYWAVWIKTDMTWARSHTDDLFRVLIETVLQTSSRQAEAS